MCVCVCMCVCSCVRVVRCEELVQAYLKDPSPEAVLLVGGDIRKIKYCFGLLKVTCIVHSERVL